MLQPEAWTVDSSSPSTPSAGNSRPCPVSCACFVSFMPTRDKRSPPSRSGPAGHSPVAAWSASCAGATARASTSTSGPMPRSNTPATSCWIWTEPPRMSGPACAPRDHHPCVVLQTSPGHLQAWVRVSPTPLDPALATHIGKHLARAYGADPASTDWGHLGRLAGFTNRKPTRRQPSGYALGCAPCMPKLSSPPTLTPCSPPPRVLCCRPHRTAWIGTLKLRL
jgi:hypothetical protein